MDPLSSWLTLVRAPGLHAARLRPLLERFGCADSILVASAVELVFEGLHLAKRLNKDAVGGRAQYRARG